MPSFVAGGIVILILMFAAQTYGQVGGETLAACVKRDGTMQMIGDGFRRTVCREGEKLVVWNIQGATGAQGPQGEAGSQGEQGPQGIAGTSIPCVRVDGNDVYFEGCNIHLTNGAGSTATKNGLGNLIIGYNEQSTGLFSRDGSHNLVVGPEHEYISYGGFTTGRQNQLVGANSTIVGGSENHAVGELSSITGGWRNSANGLMSWIGAGRYNSTTGVYASVSGGEGNNVIGNSSTISGGLRNKTTADYASVAGGNDNLASGGSAAVCGGVFNEARSGGSSVTGGNGNLSWGPHATVSGGLNRTATGTDDWIAGSLFEDN